MLPRFHGMPICLAACACFVVCLASGLPAGERDNVLDSFEVSREDGLLMVPVCIGEREYPFAIDTGATVSMFDEMLQSAFIWTNREMRLNGKDTYAVWESAKASIGPRRAPLVCRAIRVDFEGQRQATGRPTWGVLGMDFLRPHIVEFDFDAGVISFLKTATNIPGKKFHLTYDRFGLPNLDLQIADGGDVTFKLDTGHVGSSHGTLSTKIFDRLMQAGAVTPVAGRSHYFLPHGAVEGRLGIAGQLRLGSFCHVGATFDEGEQNLLGLGYLSRYKVTFDFLDNAVYLEPGKSFANRCPVNRLGFVVTFDDGDPIVRDVEPEGIAGRLGIRTNDRLVTLDGADVRTMTPGDIYRLLFHAPNGRRLSVNTPPEKTDRAILIPKRPIAETNGSPRAVP